jgi:hypothetical protein
MSPGPHIKSSDERGHADNDFDAQVELVGSLADGYSYYWKRKVDDFAVDAVKGAQKFRE